MEELLCDNINNEDVNNYNDMNLYLQNISENKQNSKIMGGKSCTACAFNDAVCES